MQADGTIKEGQPCTRLKGHTFFGFAAEAQNGMQMNFQLAAARSSGFRSRIVPRRFVRMPARSQSFKERLTVNGVTFAPSATSSFVTFISTPSVVTVPIPFARLTNKWAMRPLASSELRETCAAIHHAVCSVTEIDKVLSSNFGLLVTKPRIVCLSQTTAQQSVSTSVERRYRTGVAIIAAPPNICPGVSQCIVIFRPSSVIRKCLPRPLVSMKSRSAGSSWLMITEDARKCRCFAADKTELTSASVSPDRNRGLRWGGRPRI